MDNSSGMRMGEGVRQPQGLVPERLTAETLEKYWTQIKDLSSNALDTGEGSTYGEREGEVKEDHLYEEYLKEGGHGELYVLVKDEKVVAFLAIKKGVQDREAEIEQLRLVQGPDQERYIGEILEFAKKKLEEEGYHHGVVDPKAANDYFESVANRISSFLHTKKSESGEKLAA